MANSPRSGVATAQGYVGSAVDHEPRDISHVAPCATFSFVCRLEGALQAAGENENVDNLLLGVGAVVLCFVLGYAIVVLTRCQWGFFAIGLG